MDLRQIRQDLATVAREAGFNAFDFQPDDPQNYPAAVVGGVKEMQRLNRLTTRVQIGVTLFAAAADALDATRVLDRALSVNVADKPDSYLDWLDSVTDADGAAWRSVRFVESGPYVKYTMPGASGAALGVEITLELTA